MLSIKTWKELNRFKKLTNKERRIVFYAENKASINHFRQLINELTKNRDLEICYVTSIENDPFAEEENAKINFFYIGEGSARTQFFVTLEADILIMDMPDLENFHIKRSKIFPVHYIYIFHSVFSTHTYLRKDALFNFDTIFCVGPHHVNEIKKSEEMYSLKSKNLIHYGFGRIDELFLKIKKENISIDKKTIIITPTYGKNNLLERCGNEIIQLLLDSGFRVILRPHFRILKESKYLIKNIEKKFGKNKNFSLEKGIISTELFQKSVCMITDWSGISFEYAFVFEKPVIFIDLPQKILNSNYKELEIEPFEIRWREKVGTIISVNNLEKILEFLNTYDQPSLKIQIQKIRSSTIYNIGNSNKVGADYIEKFLLNKN